MTAEDAQVFLASLALLEPYELAQIIMRLTNANNPHKGDPCMTEQEGNDHD